MTHAAAVGADEESKCKSWHDFLNSQEIDNTQWTIWVN